MARVYTLAKGRALSHREERGGASPHFQILLECDETLMRLAINTRSGSSKGRESDVLFLADDNFQHPLVDSLATVADGVDASASRPGGLAIDYQRGNLFDPRHMRRIPASRPGDRNDLSDELLIRTTRAINNADARVYAYGTRWGPEQHSTDYIFGFSPGNGIHDIHMNQGNADEHRHDNGTWADGALLFSFGSEAPWTALFLAFQTQSWHTNDHGDPVGRPAHPRNG